MTTPIEAAKIIYPGFEGVIEPITLTEIKVLAQACNNPETLPKQYLQKDFLPRVAHLLIQSNLGRSARATRGFITPEAKEKQSTSELKT
jgi:hypothetical protein